MLIDTHHHFSGARGFLVLEGVNGAGKTTLQEKLGAHIAPRRKVVKTREPGATRLGQSLRAMLLEGSAGEISDLAELFLFAANRAEHVSKLIRPALDRGEVVLCDRFLYSTLAFQGHGRGLDLSAASSVNEIAIAGLRPDLVLLLDLDAREGLVRSGRREDADKDSFEKEDLQFHERIRQGFLEVARSRPEPFLILDASKGPDEIFAAALPAIERWIGAVTGSAAGHA